MFKFRNSYPIYRYYRILVIFVLSVACIVATIILQHYCLLFLVLYAAGVLAVVAYQSPSLPLSKNLLSDFVEVLGRMHNLSSEREFLQLAMSVLRLVNLRVTDFRLFVDKGFGVYEIVGEGVLGEKRKIEKNKFPIFRFLETSKVRVSFIRLRNVTFFPKEVSDSVREIMREFNAEFLVPIYSPNSEVVGLVLFRAESGGSRKLFYLSQFLNVIGLIFKAVSDTEKRKALEEDMRIASQIQRRIIPTDYITNSWFESYGIYIPAYNVSGDYLDIIEGKRGFSFVVGDVAGKGVSAGLVSIMVKAILNSTEITPKSLTKVAKDLNYYVYKWFYDEESILTFLTLFIGNYIPSRGKLYYLNAGHVPCAVVKPKEIFLIPSNSRPLGLFESVKIRRGTISISSGDILVLYTDGLIEQIDRRGREFGISRVKEVLQSSRGLTPKEIVEKLVSKFNEFSQKEPNDDVCILAVKFR